MNPISNVVPGFGFGISEVKVKRGNWESHGTYGRRTRMKSMPSKYLDDAPPIIKANPTTREDKDKKRACNKREIESSMSEHKSTRANY